MKTVYNPFTDEFDFVNEASDFSSDFLKLDQTTPQAVGNGSPKFNEGLTIKSGEKLYLDG